MPVIWDAMTFVWRLCNDNEAQQSVISVHTSWGIWHRSLVNGLLKYCLELIFKNNSNENWLVRESRETYLHTNAMSNLRPVQTGRYNLICKPLGEQSSGHSISNILQLSNYQCNISVVIFTRVSNWPNWTTAALSSSAFKKQILLFVLYKLLRKLLLQFPYDVKSYLK